jgi:hypothetical protein
MSIELYRDLYQERAGILQFDAGLSQNEAEEKALIEITNLWLDKVKLNLNEPKTYNLITKFKREVLK